MMLKIRNNLYDFKNLFRLKRFCFYLSCPSYDFICVDLETKCGECFICKCDGVTISEEAEKLTNYYSFLCHKDNEGGYLDFTKLTPSENNIFVWGDLERLKLEVKDINRYVDQMPEDLLETWKNFYQDVMSSVDVLEFNVVNNDS